MRARACTKMFHHCPDFLVLCGQCCLLGIPSVLQALASQPIEQAKARRLRPAGLCSERNLTPFVSGFSGGRVKQHPIANPNRHGGEAFGVRTTWGWVQ